MVIAGHGLSFEAEVEDWHKEDKELEQWSWEAEAEIDRGMQKSAGALPRCTVRIETREYMNLDSG